MQEYMAVVYTDTGYYYIGPGPQQEIINGVAEDRHAIIPPGLGYKSIEHIYVFPYNSETCMPDSDADPVWMWHR